MERKTFVIDANIFLELLLDQNQAEVCAQLLQFLEDKGHTIVITLFAIYGMEVVLEAKGAGEVIKSLLQRCQQSLVIEVLHTNLEEEHEIFTVAQQQRLDIDDAHQYWAAKKLNALFVSFDKDFDHTDLQRLEPKTILAQHLSQ
ncbi:MAG: type II toxin-antitoxin system VapC family toxin [Candidatus Kerfeldbacteria bacterium]|nr:type II toxin-antitoxin system VapC family toxin [Candidatus Kerfeldbacteria bacterium]